jgi:two-component system chemotaxis sensor kinase CheA
LPHSTYDDLVEALYADGGSTRVQVGSLSGRGVGMAAVRAATDALGGRVEIQSEAGARRHAAFPLPQLRRDQRRGLARPRQR